MPQLIRLTPTNASHYIGHEIIFKTNRGSIVRRLLSVSQSSYTIYIDYPDRGNNLVIYCNGKLKGKKYVIIV
jgi:hypothetical protein